MRRLEPEESWGATYIHLLTLTESGYGREQLLLLALRLACRDLRGPQVPAEDLVVDYLGEAHAMLQQEEGLTDQPTDEGAPRPRFYVLDGPEGHTPRPASDEEFIAWLGARFGPRAWEDPQRRVAHDTLPDGTRVSTVFLGLDHNYQPSGPPILFETMSFPVDPKAEQRQARYATWEEAEAGHALILGQLKEVRRGPPSD